MPSTGGNGFQGKPMILRVVGTGLYCAWSSCLDIGNWHSFINFNDMYAPADHCTRIVSTPLNGSGCDQFGLPQDVALKAHLCSIVAMI